MRSTMSGLFFLTLFLALGLVIGSRRRCEEKKCVFYTKCPTFLRLNERFKAMQSEGTTDSKAGKELAKTLRSMVCDKSAGKVCCPEGNINTEITVINYAGFPVKGEMVGKISGGNLESFPWGPIPAAPPLRPLTIQTPFTSLPTFFLVKHINGQDCISRNVLPSSLYSILSQDNDCYVFSGITIINKARVPIKGAITGRRADGELVVAPYGPIKPGQQQGKTSLDFTIPTNFTAVNNNNGRTCIFYNVPLSPVYVIEGIPDGPQCRATSGVPFPG